MDDSNDHLSGRIWSMQPGNEDFQKQKSRHKSKRTIFICSVVLLAVTAALTTWVFVVRPSFFPKLKIATRNDNEAADAEAEARHHINRRSEDIEEEAEGRSKIHRKTKLAEIFEEVGKKDFPFKSNRLPRDLLPEDYYISLDVDLTKDTYGGDVDIDLKCVNRTKYFIFHSRKLQIKSIRIRSPQPNKEMKIKRVLFYEKHEMFLVELVKHFIEGRDYSAIIEFETKFNPYLAGFYKSQYRTQNGNFRTVATSHFEPTDARSAFPCLDEPNFKAKYHISLIHSADYIALSNMPIEISRSLGEGRIEDSFQTSVRMSTYLVAFAVVDFKYKEAKTESGMRVRVYAPESDYDRIDYAVEVGAKVISFYERFFGAPYPLPKLDMLAVPDFLAGAMEDWGLVSFRSSYLIYEQDKVTLDQKKMVTLVIAHELAHQWFGNLVTMKWWNDIWLNEGFANFVEMLGTNEVNKKFHSLDLQVPTGWHTAIGLDSLKNSHPIDQEVDTPSEIDELFDAISYNKGAALLRMVRSFLGKDFIKGVKDYIQTHKFKNAETNDLWKHLKKADHTNTLEIKDIMETWTRQSGFPVLTIKRENDDLLISQKSFLLERADSKRLKKLPDSSEEEGSTDDEAPEDLKWHIPFTYVFDDAPNDVKKIWLNNETQVRVKAQPEFKWLKANMNSDNYYIVNYDKQTWHGIIKQLKTDHEVFSPADRANLIHDAFKLGCDGIITPMIPLQLAKYLKNEKHYIPWAMARAKLDCMTMMIQDKKIKKGYKKYFWYLQSHLVNTSDLDVDKYNLTNPLEVFQRYDTFSYALKYGFRKDFKKKLEGYFDDMKKGKIIPGMPAELRALTLVYASDPKNDGDFEFLWKTYVETPLDADRRFIMKAFSRVKDKKKLKVILNASLDDKKVRVQDTIPLMMTLVKTGGRKQVWEFVEQNFKKLAYRYGGKYQLGTLVAEVAGGFYKQNEYERVKKFLSKHSLGKKGSRTELQVLEKIKNNLDKHTSSATDNKSGLIERWVRKQMKNTPGKI